MSWSDPCGNCGQHRADCECTNYSSVKENTCEYCKNDCKKVDSETKKYGSCKNFKLSVRK